MDSIVNVCSKDKVDFFNYCAVVILEVLGEEILIQTDIDLIEKALKSIFKKSISTSTLKCLLLEWEEKTSVINK